MLARVLAASGIGKRDSYGAGSVAGGHTSSSRSSQQETSGSSGTRQGRGKRAPSSGEQGSFTSDDVFLREQDSASGAQEAPEPVVDGGIGREDGGNDDHEFSRREANAFRFPYG